MALNLDYEPGQTPLDADEAAQLMPRHITTQGALNEWEQANILPAVQWASRQRLPAVLTEDFCRELHRRMFHRTWRWAGQFRQSDKNIGCPWTQVAARLRQLLDNTSYQLEQDVFPIDEAAARFHHQLVKTRRELEQQGVGVGLAEGAVQRQLAASAQATARRGSTQPGRAKWQV